ncbi:MAG: diguanylate cyclase with sensor [Thermoleophilia bacterium]|nr:diguanylate cyclase with sensor [Thermoleophilia bacterium]
MSTPGSNRHADRPADPLLRAVNRATSAAAAVLDPDIIPGNAADALVRYLGARRADIWRFDGRRPVHLACAGNGAETPSTLPSVLMRVARGGLAQTVTSDELGHGAGTEWRRLLFSVGVEEVSIHALTVGDRVLGAITIIAEPTDQPIADEAWTIFAQQVAASMQQAELHRAAQDAALAMRVQNRVLAELTDERDVPSLRAAVEHLVAELLGDAAVAVLPMDSLGRVTVPVLVSPADGTLRVATAPEMAFVAPALEHAVPTTLPSPSLRMCASLGLSSLAGHASVEDSAVWAVQLRAGDRTTGVLLVGTPGDEMSTPAGRARVCEVLLALAPAVSIALENAQLFAREYVRASRLSAANTLARTVTGCATRDDLYTAVVIGIGALFGYARAAVYDGDLKPLANEGCIAARGSDRERSLVSTALHRRRSSRVERPDRTCHAIPLVSGERIHGVLYAEQPDTVTPEQESDDLALLASICEHAAACLVAIEATEKIERNYKDTIQALVHALEARDEYTADHSDVVAEWSLETGRRLGMDDAALRDLELGAILHDIGKVAIPDAILNKAGRLTEEEFEVMKSHTIVGERILKPIGFLVNVAPIVRHEHERWDGRGYPDGVAGEDIPLASRIIFVCDAYHAITSDRPYRAGQTHTFARRIITENAGTQFDPAVVSVFLDVIESWCGERGIDTGGTLEGMEINNPLGGVAAKEIAPADEDAAAA